MPSSPDSKMGEIAKVKNKMVEVEAHLKEAKKASLKLREALEKKINQVSIVDENIAEVVENFRWKKEELMNIINNQKSEANEKIESMKERINKIRLETSGMGLLKHESDLLHFRLKELCSEQIQNQLIQQKELDKKKQVNFDLRMAMDEIMRKVIKSSDEDYLNEARRKMEIEAVHADHENKRIIEEFNMRERQTNNLIRQQQQSFEKLKKINIEKDVFASTITYQQLELLKLTHLNQCQKQENEDVIHTIESLNYEISDLLGRCREKDELRTEISQLKNDFQITEELRKQFFNESINLCNIILSESLVIADLQNKKKNDDIFRKMNKIGE